MTSVMWITLVMLIHGLSLSSQESLGAHCSVKIPVTGFSLFLFLNCQNRLPIFSQLAEKSSCLKISFLSTFQCVPVVLLVWPSWLMGYVLHLVNSMFHLLCVNFASLEDPFFFPQFVLVFQSLWLFLHFRFLKNLFILCYLIYYKR